MEILETLKKVKEQSKKRNFTQTWDLIVNLNNMDLKKQENRFSEAVALPNGRGKNAKVCVIADSLAPKAKDIADVIINRDELENLGKNKKRLKKLCKDVDFFFAEVSLMPMIGKVLGIVLGPRGKMPKPLPPSTNLEPIISNAKKTVRIKLSQSPVVHVMVGSEAMKPEDVEKNIEAVLEFLSKKLPRGKDNIGNVFVKLTMGKPERVV